MREPSVVQLPRGLIGFTRPVLIVAHPGHELTVFGWLSHVRPRVYILTDGAGVSGASRLASSEALVRDVGATRGGIFGAAPEARFYQAIVNRETAFFTALTDQLADELVRHDADLIAGDASEGFNPNHDVCRLVIEAAAAIAGRRLGHAIANYEFILGEWLLSGSSPHDTLCQHVMLGEALFRRKLESARHYPGLDAEVERALVAVGEDFFRTECFRPASAARRTQSSSKPYYETFGEQRLASGRVSTVIRRSEHLIPLEAALSRHAQANRPAR